MYNVSPIKASVKARGGCGKPHSVNENDWFHKHLHSSAYWDNGRLYDETQFMKVSFEKSPEDKFIQSLLSYFLALEQYLGYWASRGTEGPRCIAFSPISSAGRNSYFSEKGSLTLFYHQYPPATSHFTHM